LAETARSGSVVGQVLRNIVIGIDFSKASIEGLAAASRIAEEYESKRLHLVHVVSLPGGVLPMPKDLEEAARSRAQERLDELEVAPGLWVTREVRVGIPARQLVAAAEHIGADLVMVAGQGHGVLAGILGSVASSLIRISHCPVLILRGEQLRRFDDVVAAIDLSAISRNVLDCAFRVAARQQGRVMVLSLYEHPLLKAQPDGILPRAVTTEDIEVQGAQQRKEVVDLIAKVPSHGVDVQVEVMSKAPAANVIVDVARMTEADLIVLGTSGQGAWHRMILGSTANHVLNRAPCPVMVVPHEVLEEAPLPAGLPA
jgi:nucleotide-binding universal stress UspA family protein